MKALGSRQGNVAHDRIALGLGALNSFSDGYNTYFYYVAFQQGIGRLCRSMGNKYYIFRLYLIFLHDLTQYLHDTGCYACFILMGRRYLGCADQFKRIIIDQRCIRKGTAYVNSNSNFHVPTSFSV